MINDTKNDQDQDAKKTDTKRWLGCEY